MNIQQIFSSNFKSNISGNTVKKWHLDAALCLVYFFDVKQQNFFFTVLGQVGFLLMCSKGIFESTKAKFNAFETEPLEVCIYIYI